MNFGSAKVFIWL